VAPSAALEGDKGEVRLRVHVDEAKCQGHTLCNFTAPQIFLLREEDGHAYVADEQVPLELEDLARRAALGCPEQAIVVTE
jgi:ferredoxin